MSSLECFIGILENAEYGIVDRIAEWNSKMAGLATEQQILDLQRFCSNPIKYCIMGVDPTFNLGYFTVTPIVYQHLLVEVRSLKNHLGY